MKEHDAIDDDDGLPDAMSSCWPWAREALARFASKDALVWVDDQENPPCARSVTYAELIEMAGNVSRVVARQVGDDETGIGMCLDNSLAACAVQLGALWAGHHFVPLDQPSAQPQLREMLNASRIAAIFCCPNRAAEVRRVVDGCSHSIAVLLIDDAELTRPACARFCMADASAEAAPSAAIRPRSCRRICTFHTSGTTGMPKPIHSTPEQWHAFVTAAAQPYHLTPASRVFLATSAIFDPSAGLCFAALAA